MTPNTSTRKGESRGFTIVELLIVIVVIAILAAISIVAYNGIQARAERTANNSSINSYLKALAIMRATYSFPGGNYCLGPAGKYPGNSVANFAGQACTVDANFNTSLAMTPQPDLKRNGSNGTVVMYASSFYGHTALLWGGVRPDHDCDVPNLINGNGTMTGAKYSDRDSTATYCYAAIDM